MQPLGRDRLGRLVYEGDVGTLHWQEDWSPKPLWHVCTFGPTGWQIWCDGENYVYDRGKQTVSFAVDLAASPSRTNYERYFADMGTIEEIGEAINADCNCHVEEASAFWVDFAEHLCPGGVGYWLQQEATV